jgi:2-dehydropantoate 2-reductase
MQNGIPWWYFAGNGGPWDGRTIEAVDPGGRIAAAIANERVVGSVVYPAAEIAAPGVIKHIEGTRFQLGNPDRKPSERTQRIADAFIAGGLKAPIDPEIRAEIWLKVLGNAAFNPISALTRATLVEMADDALVEPLVREMMAESLAVAAALGVVPNVTIDKRIDGARRVGMHKSSMLQDAEARKPFETDAIVGAVVELGALTGVDVPATRHVYALVKLLERSLLAGR